LVVDGRLDNEGGADAKILVDSVSTELKEYVPVDRNGQPLKENKPSFNANGTRNGAQATLEARRPVQDAAEAAKKTVAPESRQPEMPTQPAAQTSASPGIEGPQKRQPAPAEKEADGMPPEPEMFPVGWAFEEMTPGGFVIESKLDSAQLINAGIPTTPAAAVIGREAAEEEAADSPALPTRSAEPEPWERITPTPATQAQPDPTPEALPPAALVIPADQAKAETLAARHILTPQAPGSAEDVRMITVVLRSTDDSMRDNLRMRQVYGALISYPGNDRFAFLMYERGRGFQVEFPNYTTGWNRELQGRLQKLVGADNIMVESIKFH
jgi:hypothetical protein